MSASNKYRPHIQVLPEDEANADFAIGFAMALGAGSRFFEVLNYPGGWEKVRDEFLSVHLQEMRRNRFRHLVLLIDFDNETAEDRTDRLAHFKERIPDVVKDRVFVIGVWDEAEDLSKALHTRRDKIGLKIANECQEEVVQTWEHELLRHNKVELDRMNSILRPILFS